MVNKVMFEKNTEPVLDEQGGGSAVGEGVLVSGGADVGVPASIPDYSTDDDLRGTISRTLSLDELHAAEEEWARRMGVTVEEMAEQSNSQLFGGAGSVSSGDANQVVSVNNQDRPKTSAFVAEVSVPSVVHGGDEEQGAPIKVGDHMQNRSPPRSPRQRSPPLHHSSPLHGTARPCSLSSRPRPGPSAPILPGVVRDLVNGNGGRRKPNNVTWQYGMLSRDRGFSTTRSLADAKNDYHLACDFNTRLTDLRDLLHAQAVSKTYKRFWDQIWKIDAEKPSVPGFGCEQAFCRNELMSVVAYFNHRDYKEGGRRNGYEWELQEVQAVWEDGVGGSC